MRCSVDKSAIAAALGTGTVALLPAWAAVTSLPAHARSAAALAWLVAGSLLLSVLVLLAASAVRQQSRFRWLIVAVVGVPVAVLLFESGAYLYAHMKDSLAVAAGPQYRVWRNIIGMFLLAAAAVTLVWVRRRGWTVLARALFSGFGVLAALPVVFVVTVLVAARQPATIDASTAPARNVTVILVFDELDDSVLDKRIADLPNFRRLRETAMSARAMYPPANYTSESLPGMITGDDYAEAIFARGEVHVKPTGQMRWDRMGAGTSMFSDATARGHRVDLIGWHLPYCNMFKGLHACWDDAAFHAPGAEVPLPQWVLGHSRLFGAYYAQYLQRIESDLHAYSIAFFASPTMYRLHRIGRIFERQRQQLLTALSTRRSELVFAHLACPHPPSLRPESLRTMDMFMAYEANLLACDRLLGEVVALLDDSTGVQTTTLIVTSDHWFRALDWLDSGRPNTVPATRRPIPFYIRIGDGDGRSQSTSMVTNARALRALTRAAGVGDFDYLRARQILESHGDSSTRMRRF